MNSPAEEYILRSEAMRVIRSGHAFEMEFVKADRRLGIAGELVHVKQWMIVNKNTKDPIAADRALIRRTTKIKNPAHFENKTFNIFNPKDRKQHAVKVHFRLILSLNGKRVING